MKVIVIMAGGAGERFWPLSRGNHPKQLLKLTGSGQSLLEEGQSGNSAAHAEDPVGTYRMRGTLQVGGPGIQRQGNPARPRKFAGNPCQTS